MRAVLSSMRGGGGTVVLLSWVNLCILIETCLFPDAGEKITIVRCDAIFYFYFSCSVMQPCRILAFEAKSPECFVVDCDVRELSTQLANTIDCMISSPEFGFFSQLLLRRYPPVPDCRELKNHRIYFYLRHCDARKYATPTPVL
jgi:hypothetical protein